MTFDPELAERLRQRLTGEPGMSERRMFGGLAFLIHGHLAVSASGRGGLMVRVDPVTTEELMATSAAERMVMGGREMDGWLRVESRAVETDDELERWVRVALGYVGRLPPKAAGRRA